MQYANCGSQTLIGIRLAAASRGVDARWMLTLLVTIGLAIGGASLAYQMRTPADRQDSGMTLDSTVLLGVVLPISVLATTLRDASAWIAATSPRSLVAQRAVWLTVLFGSAIAVAGLVAWPLEPAQLPTVVFLGTLVLFDLAVLSTTLFGSNLGWLLPGLVALVCSTPGLVPIDYNWLVSASKTRGLTIIAIALGVVAGICYVLLDEYGMRRQNRLVERQSGTLTD